MLIYEAAVICEIFNNLVLRNLEARLINEALLGEVKYFSCSFPTEWRTGILFDANRWPKILEYNVVTAWHI
jgi:hypothetical protein